MSLKLRRRFVLSRPFSALTMPSQALPLAKSDEIGTFQLSSIHSADPSWTPLLYRQREETFPGRTAQLRHGSFLRQFRQGKKFEVSCASPMGRDDFMAEYGLTGFAVVSKGAIRMEEYRHGNSPAARNDIQSITKSFVSTALAIAHRKGQLSMNDPVGRHVGALKNTPWADVPLLALVNMSAGVVEVSEEVRPPDVPNPMYATELYPKTDPAAMIEWLQTFRKVAEPWEEFHYYNPNYYVLSLAISQATKTPLEDYISQHIWEPVGMKYDGYLRTTAAGQADGHGGLSVTLTDMCRFGDAILSQLKCQADGLPVQDGWFRDISNASTSDGPRAAGANDMIPGFGYQDGWWTPAKGDDGGILRANGAFAGLGMYGQGLWIIPKLDAVIAIQSGYPEHSWDLFPCQIQYVEEIVKALQSLEK